MVDGTVRPRNALHFRRKDGNLTEMVIFFGGVKTMIIQTVEKFICTMM